MVIYILLEGVSLYRNCYGGTALVEEFNRVV